MKLFRTVSLALALTASVSYADTAKPADKPKAGAEANPDDVKKFLVFFDKLVDQVVADKDNCPKMAADVNKLIDDNKAVLDAGQKAEAAGKTLPEDAKKHMTESAGKMMGAMQKCGQDKTVQAAFQRLDMKKKK